MALPLILWQGGGAGIALLIQPALVKIIRGARRCRYANEHGRAAGSSGSRNVPCHMCANTQTNGPIVLSQVKRHTCFAAASGCETGNAVRPRVHGESHEDVHRGGAFAFRRYLLC